jgi:rod shape-determining protein MreD
VSVDARKIILLLLVSIILLSLQSAFRSFAPKLSILCPNLLIVLVVYLALYEQHVRGSFLVFCIGLIIDISSSTILGPWAGAAVIIYLLLGSVAQGIFLDSAISIGVITFVSSLVATFSFALLNYKVLSINQAFFVDMIGESLATALCSPLVFLSLKKLERRLGLCKAQKKFS